MINELKKINEKYSMSFEDIQQYLDEIYKQYDDNFFNNKKIGVYQKHNNLEIKHFM